jgi:hypothetical protein
MQSARQARPLRLSKLRRMSSGRTHAMSHRYDMSRETSDSPERDVNLVVLLARPRPETRGHNMTSSHWLLLWWGLLVYSQLELLILFLVS